MTKKFSVLLVTILLSLVGCNNEYFSETRTVANSTLTFNQEKQSENDRIKSLIKKLRSGNAAERENAKKDILLSSEKSEENRQYIIQELIKIVAAPNIRFELIRQPERFLEWKAATEILSNLKALEAIDVLIECLDCNDGRSRLTLSVYPAAKAVVEIGEPAIPKLANALSQKSPEMRSMAALTLTVMGGGKSKEILVEALQKETNKLVADTIKNFLRNWDKLGR